MTKATSRMSDQVGTADVLFRIDVRGAELLVLSGHGCPWAMSLDGRHQSTLTPLNIGRMRTFRSELAPDATIVQQSCYTGKYFATLVKEAAGACRHVIAADGDVPRDGMSITSLQPLDVKMNCRERRHRLRDAPFIFESRSVVMYTSRAGGMREVASAGSSSRKLRTPPGG